MWPTKTHTERCYQLIRWWRFGCEAGGLLNAAVNSQDSIIGHETLRHESPKEISPSPGICFGVSAVGGGHTVLPVSQQKGRGALAEKLVCRNSAASRVSDGSRSHWKVWSAGWRLDEYADVASACLRLATHTPPFSVIYGPKDCINLSLKGQHSGIL